MPVNYAQFLAGVPSPVDRLQEGIAAGQTQQLNTQQIQQNDVILENQQAAQQAAQAQAQRKSVMNDKLAAIVNDPNKTAQSFIDLQVEFPELVDQLTEPLKQMNTEQKKVAISEMWGLKAHLSKGDVEGGIKLLEDKKLAAENSGDTATAAQTEAMIKTIRFNPDGVDTMINAVLASQDPDNFTDGFTKLAEQQRLQESEPLNIAAKLKDLDYTDAQIAKINFDMQAGTDKGFTTLSPAQVEAMGQPPGTIIQEDELGKYHVVNEGLVKFTAGQTEKERKRITEVNKDKIKGAQLINIIDNMIGSEDGLIKQHDGLNSAIGPIESQLPSFRAKVTAFEAYQKQLEGTAFLEAFQALKGGGTITETEGKKATESMGRWSAAQGESDYIAGLKDMRQVVKDRMATMGAVTITNNSEYEALAKGTQYVDPDGISRVKQ